MSYSLKSSKANITSNSRSNSNNNCSYIGVDVAKDKLDIFISDTNQFLTIPNNKTNINKFIKSYLSKILNPLIVCESTGGWERIMLLHLTKSNIAFNVAHATKIYHYAKSKGILAKTDKLDAKTIASFAISEQLPASNMVDEVQVELKDLVMRKVQLKNNLCSELQRQRKHLSKAVQNSIDRTVYFYKKELLKLDKQINKIFDSSQQYIADNRIIKSMKGVGGVTAETMIVLLPELGKVNKRQIAALVGVAPYNNDSGRKSGRRRIKGGRMEIRNVLYMAALSSIRYNPIMKKYYHQLLERQKIKKIAVIAVMRKMLVILNSMMANRTEFIAN